MSVHSPFKDFSSRLKLFISKRPDLIITTLSNIFTMRLIGNKTHGDLAEIAIAEFINQYMYDFRALHVGKDLFRAKSHEEDIKITSEITEAEFPVSLKAYGDGPLQLSTDKTSGMFLRLERESEEVSGQDQIQAIFRDAAFADFRNINVLPLIYNEKRKRCNILVFDYDRAQSQIVRISRQDAGERRRHPVYRFYDEDDDFVCEVRYGDAAANALQRGLWTHTKNASKYFDSLTNGWIDYSHNLLLVDLFSRALVASATGHAAALVKIEDDIARLKQQSGSGQDAVVSSP